MKRRKLDKILKMHKRWVENEDGGERADLSGACLSHADLSGADLSGANLSNTELREANLKGVSLRDANLRDADLRGATLRDANLRGASLSNTDLRQADLAKANLRGADLSDADLRLTNLIDANLIDTNLSGADLRLADLKRTSVANIVGYQVITCQLDTSRDNNPICYWVDLDVVTTGCFQGSLEDLKKAVEETHKNNERIRNRYCRVIKFIEETVEDYKEEDNDKNRSK